MGRVRPGSVAVPVCAIRTWLPSIDGGYGRIVTNPHRLIAWLRCFVHRPPLGLTREVTVFR